jgi:hypothetical protein
MGFFILLFLPFVEVGVAGAASAFGEDAPAHMAKRLTSAMGPATEATPVDLHPL